MSGQKIRFKKIKNKKKKKKKNRSIWIQGWYEMRRQLEYKQLWRGGQVLAVPASVHKPALRVLWSYSERKPPVTK